ncbi:MAG TPA: histidine kinase dimerization/phosphoacceptor domain -containing protein [Hyphomicrobiales bacterium]|nr:histidine kinase dimerization/phosphoacceptor domain -containing protein [Hyphomicrobiales bacterium]
MSDARATEPAHVLYIDDDAGLARLVMRNLGRHGFAVEHAATGDDGLRRLAERRFDIVALDHFMPGQDGLATLARIRALPDPPPVVYVTGSDESRIAVAALKAGAADHVIKASGRDFFDLLRSSLISALTAVRLEGERDRAMDEMRAANARLEALVGQQEMLLREVNHRVANSLQIIASLVRMQAAQVSDTAAKNALFDTQHRIEVIMQVHRRLYTSADVGMVEMDKYLEGLCGELSQSLAAEGQRHQLEVAAAPLAIPTDKAVSVGVIVTELVTNAYKYAYPAGSCGAIRIAFSKCAPSRVALSVEDDGVGMGHGGTSASGLGQRLIHAMAGGLGSEVEIDPAHRGTRVTIAFAI